MINRLQFEVAFEKAQGEKFQRSLSTVLQELEYLDARNARAITAALDRLEASSLGQQRVHQTPGTTDRLARTLDLEGEEADALAEEEAQRRSHDLGFAAVALREGMILVPELERAVREQVRREHPVPLEAVLLERGVLTQDDVDAIAKALEASRDERLVIPGHTVLDVIGYGATSIVLRARQDMLERDVAIKLFHADYTANTSALAEEARAVARVEHPNVVGIYDVGRVHRRVYYVMEFVDGPNLAELLRKRGRLEDDDLGRLARDLLHGLEAIHGHGLVHRDVKPLNVLLAEDGTARLTDLGLACEAGLEVEDGALYGSPLTMSPEQAQGDSTDARADLYGLGATLYIAATGQPPFPGSDSVTILMGHMTDPVPDPRALRPALGEKFAGLIMDLMAKSPGDRPQSAAEVLTALETSAP